MRITIEDKGTTFELKVQEKAGAEVTTVATQGLAKLLQALVRILNPGVSVRANENMIDAAGQTYDRVEWWH